MYGHTGESRKATYRPGSPWARQMLRWWGVRTMPTFLEHFYDFVDVDSLTNFYFSANSSGGTVGLSNVWSTFIGLFMLDFCTTSRYLTVLHWNSDPSKATNMKVYKVLSHWEKGCDLLTTSPPFFFFVGGGGVSQFRQCPYLSCFWSASAPKCMVKPKNEIPCKSCGRARWLLRRHYNSFR